MLAGFPVLAQVGAFPPGEPAQEERLPFETEPAPAAEPSPPAGAPAVPPSPFGLSPDVFPGIFGRPDRPAQEQPAAPPSSPPAGAPAVPPSPFGLSPDVFPGIFSRPDRPAQEQPAAPPSSPAAGAPAVPPSPFGLSPDVFPGIFSRPDRRPQERPAEPGVSGVPGAETGAPGGPQPGLAGTPEVPPPPAFVTPPYGYGGLAPGLFLPPPDQALPAPPPNVLPSTALAPLSPGALPVQAYNLRAPPILIQPIVSVFGGYTDNPNNTPKGFSDGYARVYGNTAVSVDTVRLQGQLVGGVNYQKYARATDQDWAGVNLLGYGLGTVVQDHIFIDGRAAITQTSQSGGLIFASPDLISKSNRSQVFIGSVTPIARQSFGGYVDGELRYNYATTMYQNPSGTTSTTFANLNDATRNEVTATLASGRLSTLVGSRFTFDALKIDSLSAARSTQLRVFNDVSYQFNDKFAGLARVGYENLDYPLQPSANFQGPTWELGGRYAPFSGNYFVGTYGRRDGLLGFSGAFRYEITARAVALASFTRNRASQQQLILNNFTTSVVDANGIPINQFTGLPVALGSTNFGFSNAVFKYETANAGLQTVFERDSLALFAFLSRQSPLGTPIGTAAVTGVTNTTTTGGVNLSWNRSLTPRLNSTAAVGFTRLISPDQNTVTVGWSMSYLLGERLTAVLNYQIINVDSSGGVGSYRRNQVEIGLTRSF